MGMKPRPRYLLLARPKRRDVPGWWPKAIKGTDETKHVVPKWVTVHEDGWTVGRDRAYALSRTRIVRARELFLDEYGPDDDDGSVPGIAFEFREEMI